jgi:hypothetical protein
MTYVYTSAPVATHGYIASQNIMNYHIKIVNPVLSILNFRVWN